MSGTQTHYRKAFNSPYLSSADIVEPTTLTIKEVRLENDQSKKSKDKFNTAYFVEKEIRAGEPLKPMILNVGNSKMIKDLAGSPFIEEWKNIPVTIYVDNSVKFGRDTVEGLRISAKIPFIGSDQIQAINKLVGETKADFVKFKQYMKVSDIGKILVSDYKKAISILNRKKEEAKK